MCPFLQWKWHLQSQEDCDDLCNLQTVTEESVLEALRQRFYRLKIYTYAGNILIAVNPNKFLPGWRVTLPVLSDVNSIKTPGEIEQIASSLVQKCNQGQ
uniref:Myosin motor domain-containing protein n=1 Tax=Monopterus albus TaxID=43700 RepID=A0A3Q3R4P4_MONAL